MSPFVRLLDGRSVLRLAAAGMTAAMLAGCSSDVTRLGDPFANPFANSARFGGTDPQPTASIAQNGNPGAPVGRVMSAPLDAPIQTAAIPPVRGAGLPQPSLAASAHSSPLRANSLGARSGYRMASAEPSLPSASGGGMARVAHGYWTATGGTPIVVGRSDTAGVVAQRYGVPVDALLRVNGFTSSAEIRPGTNVIIPVYNAGAARMASESPAVASRRHVAEARSPRRETAARSHHEERVARVSAHEKMRFVTGPQPKARPKLDEDRHARLEHDRSHERKLAEEKAGREKLARAEAEKKEHEAKLAHHHEVVASARVAKVEQRDIAPTRSSHAQAEQKVDHETTASVPAKSEKVASAEPEFRWPAHGRVIQAFKPGINDGINIAVPDGTPVKAAEAGVVAYAGNELKGYGNLVLIRHPNGFVSAYANNGQIDVKRGETVSRGQVIAKSGQTGNVVSPQLHFELRKGQTPVNPMRYLAGL